MQSIREQAELSRSSLVSKFHFHQTFEQPLKVIIACQSLISYAKV